MIYKTWCFDTIWSLKANFKLSAKKIIGYNRIWIKKLALIKRYELENKAFELDENNLRFFKISEELSLENILLKFNLHDLVQLICV